MSEPIIIETPAPPTRERLVLVPSTTANYYDVMRDATPADLERAGYARGNYGPEAWESACADACRREDEQRARAEKAERERDEARRLHSEAEAQVACRTELRAQVASLRAELARLTAPAEGSCWACREELGVAHERARQQPEKDRATEDELKAAFLDAYPAPSSISLVLGPGVRAVAARVRQECLVAQAVGMGAGVTISRMSERVPGTTGMWDVYVTRRPDVPGEHYAYGVPVADVPATLARLLGEVSRG